MRYNWIKGKLPKICGNYMIIAGDKPVITSDVSDSSLSDSKYKDFPINESSFFERDMGNLFRDVEPSIFFSGEDFEFDRTIRTTLILYSDIPSRFIIMKKNGSENREDHTIHKTFDFTNSSVLGKYLKKLVSNENFSYDPIRTNFEQNEISINCLDIVDGSITTKEVYMENFSNDFVTNIWEENFCIPVNILPISFKKDWDEDEDEDFYWFYSDDCKLGDFHTKNNSKNFTGSFAPKFVEGEQEVLDYRGMYISENLFFYCKNNDVFTQSSNIQNDSIFLQRQIPSFFSVKEEKPWKEIDGRKTLKIKLQSSFEQSDIIEVLFTNGEKFTFVADSFPNVPNHLPTDNIQNIFNPIGTISQQCESISKAFRFSFINKKLFDVFHDDTNVYIRYIDPKLSNEIIDITSSNNVFLLDGASYPIGVGGGIMFTSEADVEKGDFIQSKNGYHKVVGTFWDVEENQECYFAERSFFGEKDFSRIWKRDRIEFGIINPTFEGSLPESTILGRSVVSENIGLFLHQEKLVVGEEYFVVEGQIFHMGNLLSQGDTFVAIDTEYTKNTTDVKILISRYFSDIDVQQFLETHLDGITSGEKLDLNISWADVFSKDTALNKLSVENSRTKNLEDYDFSPNLNTHNFFLLSENFDGVFDESKYLQEEDDVFAKFFKKNVSYFRSNNVGEFETIFHGIKFSTTESVEGWGFACYLDVKNLDDIGENKPISWKIYKNNTFENMLLKIDVYLKDYKAFENMGYLYFALMNRILDENLVSGLSYPTPQISNMSFNFPSLNGIKIHQKVSNQSPSNINNFLFDGDIFRLDTWTSRTEESLGGFVGFSEQRDSFIMTFNNPSMGSNTISLGAPMDIDIRGNELELLSGMVYVGSINGTIIDSVIPVATLKSIEIFNDYEWYQIIQDPKPYENVRRLLSAASIKHVLESEPKELYKEIKLQVTKPKKGYYDSKFNLDSSFSSNVEHSFTDQNWSLILDPWVLFEDVSWDSFPTQIDLGLIFPYEINNINA